MKIIGTGLSGLVGTRIAELLEPQYSFQFIEYNDTDITDRAAIKKVITSSDAAWMFHFAAKTDVDACEREKAIGEHSEAWKVNVLATEYIVNACEQSNKKLIYMSTDYVFDGTRQSYAETDSPHPLSWYGQTKLEGEYRVQALPGSVIIRIANPYRAYNALKMDFVHKILEMLSQDLVIESPSDQIFMPTFIDDIARAVSQIVQNNASGLYHVTGSQALSPFAAAQKIARAFGYNPSLVKSVAFTDYFSGRAPRPFHALLRNDKIQKLGVSMSTLDEGLEQIASQNPQLVRHSL